MTVRDYLPSFFAELEAISLHKEAGFKYIASKGIGGIKNVSKKALRAGNYISRELYHRSTPAVRSTMHDMAVNPGSYGTLAGSASSLGRLLTGG